jgi:hypothetical protein
VLVRGQKTNTDNKATGNAEKAMKKVRRPSRFVLRSDQLAISGFVMASNARAMAVMIPSTVKKPKMRPV